MCSNDRYYLYSISAILLIALTIYGSPLGACSCLPPLPPKEALKGASSVFLGKLHRLECVSAPTHDSESISTNKYYRHLFSVEKVWKGEPRAEIEILCRRDNSGFYFEENETYLIYAYRYGDSTILVTNVCTRTTHVKYASDDLKDLGEGIKVK